MKTKFKEFSLNENIMNIIELSNLTTLIGLEADAILEMLRRAYKAEGDEGVIDMYKEITGIKLESIGKGRYIVKK